MKMFSITKGPGILFALLILSWACSDKKDPPPKTKAGVASKSAPKALVIPNNVVAYGGVDSVADYLAKATRIGQAITSTAPPIEPMIKPMLQTRFRLKSTEAIELDSALRFALFDQKSFGADPSALMFGIRERAAFERAIPDLQKKANDRDNAWSYLKSPSAKRPVFVNFLEKNVVLTRHPEVFIKNKSFLLGLLQKPMGPDAVTFLHVGHASTLYDQKIKANVRDIKALLEGQALGQEGQKDALMEVVDSIENTLRQTDEVEIAIKLNQKNIALSTKIHPKKDSDLAKTINRLKAAPHQLLAQFPSDTPFFFSAAVTPGTLDKRFASLLQASPIGWTLAVLSQGTIPEGPGAKLIQAAKKALEDAGANAFTMAAHSAGAAADLTLSAIMQAENIKGVVAAEQQLVDALGQNDIAQHYAKLSGSQLKVSTAPFQIGGLKVTRWGTENENMDLLPPGLQGISTVYSLVHKNRQMMAYGTSSESVLNTHAANGYSGLGESATVKSLLERAGQTPIALVYLSPLEIAKRAQLGGMNPVATTLADLDSGGGLSLIVTLEGGSIRAVLDTPTAMLKQGMTAFERLKGVF